MNIFEYLVLRSEFEDLSRYFVGVNQNGTLESMKNFIESGHKKNRFREGFDRALEICQEVVNGQV